MKQSNKKSDANFDRRSFLYAAAGTAVLGSFKSKAGSDYSGISISKSLKPKEMPNIIIMMTDQQRFDALGCMGDKAAHTPNIDRLAEEGTLFERCYVSNPICTPSRASMLTGKTVPGHGLYRLYDNLPEDEIMFPEYLRRAGYKTAMFGKMHTSGRLKEAKERHPNDGFEIYKWCIEPYIHQDSPLNAYTKWLREKDPAFAEKLRKKGRSISRIPRELHMTKWAADNTIDLINDYKEGNPFFGIMSVFDPHNPYEGYPPEMAELIDEDKIEDPILKKSSDEPSPIAYERNRSHLGSIDNFSLEELREMKKNYLATIAFFDEQVGRVLDALDEKGIADNTLVVVTSDGGDMLGDHQLLAKGAFLYEQSIRVPLIMRWPSKMPSGKRVRELTQLQDLACTSLSAAGIMNEKIQSTMPESLNLAALANGNAERWRDFAVSTFRNTGIMVDGQYPDPPIHITMIRETRYKLIAYLNPRGSEEPFEGQIFDMHKDPHELNNLWDSPEHIEIKLRLISKLAGWETRQELMLGSPIGGDVPGAKERLDNRLEK
ncbi:sulfatase [Sedimentisphaera salicampi]|uniref:Arylsulfatase n=1 Tax=Sedimentisphaera salicampi TaxID=1941349 RepID=A0A1W6LMS2_9BACT|nr:sulfatase-like hydrolase/transferase [Sedimentisphaera salicampi]ARN57100.1 Arylsulfatase [Sedimentisphaera salicampi]